MKTNKSNYIARLRSRSWQQAVWAVGAIWILSGMRGGERFHSFALAQESNGPPVTTSAVQSQPRSAEKPATAEKSEESPEPTEMENRGNL